MSRPHLPKDPAFPRANGSLDGGTRGLGGEIEEVDAAATIAVEQSPSQSSSPTASSPPAAMSSCGQYMLHRVRKLDTLAGVAIKYGVEVADIKRLNGLSTDLQMFAHKTLRIPLPGRHPPSSYQQNGSDESDDRECTPRRIHDDILDSILKTPKPKVSPAMSLLQGYYGLAPPPKRDQTGEGTEMAVYGKGKSAFLDVEPWLEPPNSEPFSLQNRKTKSLTIGSSLLDGDTDENGDSERLIRRRQKADGELLPREENGGDFLASAGKGLALRPKSSNRSDMNKSQQNLFAMAEPLFSNGVQTVRKSSSTPEFQEPESNTSSSIWGNQRKPARVSHHHPRLATCTWKRLPRELRRQQSTVHRRPRLPPLSRTFPMATPSSPPAAPAATAAASVSVSRLPPLRPSLPHLRFCSAPTAAAVAASPISLGPGCRPLPSIRCRAAAGPSPPSSEPPPPSGWQERLSRLQDRARIFFAVLFWMSLFFWGSAWDGSNNSGGKKRQRFRKKSK